MNFTRFFGTSCIILLTIIFAASTFAVVDENEDPIPVSDEFDGYLILFDAPSLLEQVTYIRDVTVDGPLTYEQERLVADLRESLTKSASNVEITM